MTSLSIAFSIKPVKVDMSSLIFVLTDIYIYIIYIHTAISTPTSWCFENKIHVIVEVHT